MSQEGPPPLPCTPRSSPERARQQQQQRRSARVLHHDPIVAPGYGTHKDLANLTAALNKNEPSTRKTAAAGKTVPEESTEHFLENTEPLITVPALTAIMKSRGDGSAHPARRGRRPKIGGLDVPPPAPAAANINAWADFMTETGMGAAPPTTTTSTTAPAAAASARSKRNEVAETVTTEAASETAPRDYDLSSLETIIAKKFKKIKVKHDDGVLCQTGTLDARLVGRTKLGKEAAVEPYHLWVPTRLLPSVLRVRAVYSNCVAAHAMAIDSAGRVYGWGRNEAGQLGAHWPDNIVLPTMLAELNEVGPIRMAALGKSHTLFLTAATHAVLAVGANKVGQCGIGSFTETVARPRPCAFVLDANDDLEDVLPVVQIAAGEDFSVALSAAGDVYSTGSSEFGQLGNGATGEYFVTANKLAFENCSSFLRRSVYCHVVNEKLHTADAGAKVVPLPGTVKICKVACGKHHTIALEAPIKSGTTPQRVFTWGSGDYGVLGHGLQKDEYFPRHVGALKLFATESSSTPLTSHDTQLSAGTHCSLVQTKNGHVYYNGKHRSVGEAVMRPQLVDALANNAHVVTRAAAGGQTVVCCTTHAQTVAWGQGPHGELGLDDKRSSAKPTFVERLDGCQVNSLACGYGNTYFVLDDSSSPNKATVQALPAVEAADVAGLVSAVEGAGSKRRVMM